MVLPLGPGKFYGSSLPRPRFYMDVKFSDERVDPPVSVNDPLLLWASEAHWSMGGLSLHRLRLQGKIEGNLEKLRKEQENIAKNKPEIETPLLKSKVKKLKYIGKSARKNADSPPPTPLSRKLRLRSTVVGGDESDDEKEEEEVEAVRGEKRKRRRLARKLGDDFEMVADKSPLKDASNGGRRVSKSVRPKIRGRRAVILAEDGEESDAAEYAADAGIGSVTKEKGSDSPNTARRSSPRLKQKLN